MKKPVLTILLIALNTFIGILTFGIGADNMFALFGMYQGALSSGQGYRIFTSTLIHANIVHWGNNMLCLWYFGNRLERNLPRFKYFLIILASTIGSGIIIGLIGGQSFHGGASGVVFGLFVAEFIREKRNNEDYINTLIALVINTVLSFSAGVSWQGHFGGALGGLLSGLLFIRKGSEQVSLKQWKKEHPNCSEEFYYSYKK